MFLGPLKSDPYFILHYITLNSKKKSVTVLKHDKTFHGVRAQNKWSVFYAKFQNLLKLGWFSALPNTGLGLGLL